MFDLSWSEMAIIAIVALIVIGPKELPNALRTVAQFVKQARKMAREFQGGIDEIVREAELDEARKTLRQATSYNIKRQIESTVDPTGELKRSLDSPEEAEKPQPKPEVAGAAPPPAPGGVKLAADAGEAAGSAAIAAPLSEPAPAEQKTA